MARLGFTGDVMLGRKVDETQRRRNRPVSAVWGDLTERLRSLDALFVNLECCLSTRGERWTRTHRPFHFRADPDWAVSALDAAGVEWANLANNHLLDFGENALLDTLDRLDSAGIARSGAGEDREAARAPATVEVGDSDDTAADDMRIAFVSATDNTPEFAAGPDSPGTAYLDLSDETEARETMAEMLARARRTDPDLLVVALHWGPNMVEEPPDHFRRFGRWLAERGVDLVHGHSAHVFQAVEVHDGTPVLYDCGDFVDDYAVDSDLRNDRSFLFEVRVEDGEISELRLLPTEIDDFAVHEASAEAAAWSRKRMRELSAGFGTRFETDGEELVLEP
ncbi:CapA family protein [Halorussus sp. MSC15.2]|uniref:CapA family protein n=1 Tax=Halorussus sp. MSC15.2 TaxID=2283638 RepID=UPI0013D64D5E|nr:CapA family protein [Halorussus sp. MSC15.2]NEU55261.1 CapA family protein [Halorussus sp. MSC15.2]